MNKCPLTYKYTDSIYSADGLKYLNKNLKELHNIILSKEDLINEAILRAPKMSIQGVQPKLSAILEVKKGQFAIVDTGGQYILKPPHIMYPQLPENEDLTMKLAELSRIEIPVHGLVFAKDNALVYFIKRFDRTGKTGKLPLEDFAQLGGFTRESKYDSSMEKVVQLINEYCTFPVIEKIKLFDRVIFSFLIGNEDMHLKNYSVIRRGGKAELSPAYDLLNTSIVLNTKEEMALPINGKKRNLRKKDLINYFAVERMELNTASINTIIEKYKHLYDDFVDLINNSFLSEEYKKKYITLFQSRYNRIVSE